MLWCRGRNRCKSHDIGSTIKLKNQNVRRVKGPGGLKTTIKLTIFTILFILSAAGGGWCRPLIMSMDWEARISLGEGEKPFGGIGQASASSPSFSGGDGSANNGSGFAGVVECDRGLAAARAAFIWGDTAVVM